MKTRFLKLALLAVFCVGAAVTNAQTKLSEEAVKVIKELKQVDTKGLSAEETQTALKVLNQIKKQHSDNFVAITAVGEAKDPATPTKDGDAKLGSKGKTFAVNMITGEGVKQVAPTRKKFLIDGHETSGEEFTKALYTRKGNVNHRIFKDKESLAKYNAQGYDEVWIIETIKDKKSTETPPAPAKNGEAKVGSKSNPMVFDLSSGMGVKQIRVKHVIDGREVTPSEYSRVSQMRGNDGAKYKTLRDKESLAKYNAQGYDEIWVLETVKVEKSTTPRVTKFKQKGNQVSFRIEVPKSADRAKQKVDIEYELPAEK
jgi:hypothetical protein